jgi:hypothetical protein
MTMGPEPMTRIVLMEVSLGMRKEGDLKVQI